MNNLISALCLARDVSDWYHHFGAMTSDGALAGVQIQFPG